MLKSAVIEEKKFNHSPRVGALLSFATSLKKKPLCSLILYMYIVYSPRARADNALGTKF